MDGTARSSIDSSSTGLNAPAAAGGGAAGRGAGGVFASVRSLVISVLPTGTATGLSPVTTESWVTPNTGFGGSSVGGAGFASWFGMGAGGLMWVASLCTTSLGAGSGGVGSGSGGGGSGSGGDEVKSTSTGPATDAGACRAGSKTNPAASNTCTAIATAAPHREACSITDEAPLFTSTPLALAPKFYLADGTAPFGLCSGSVEAELSTLMAN